MTTAYIEALDSDHVSIDATPTSTRWDGRQVAVLDSSSCPLDRAATVRVIESLTSAVMAHDAAVKAREDAKFRRGDKVRPRGSYTARYVVIRDEDATGRVDLISLSTGQITEGVAVSRYVIHQRAPRPAVNASAPF
ncbi:hypothetical protein [Kribbella deserti]|uniref:Uncharacterized protein n=1 Tax=Kribbella deserti TaxID=1926257 RepID=A0ABV6QJK5_9ACTN